MEVTFSFQGFRELDSVLTEIQDDFSAKDAKNIINKGMREAMKVVLLAAQGNLLSNATVDTGALMHSLRVTARKPTLRDRRSLYVSNSDIAIATVTTASGKQLARTKFHNLRNTKSNIKQVGIKSDARAVAIEFGTAKWETGHGKPFLRPALENNTRPVVDSLAGHLTKALQKYKSKNNKG